MSLSPDASPSSRGLPRLRHRISNLFRHKSYSTASSVASTPITPTGQSQESDYTRPESKPASKGRKARDRRSKNASIIEQKIPTQKLELPRFESLQWGSDIGLTVPYFNFEPSKSGDHIDWDKELDILHKRDSKYEPSVVVTAIPEFDDGRDVGKAGNITYRSNKFQSGPTAPHESADSEAQYDVCSECHRPKTGMSGAESHHDLINSTGLISHDDANKRISQATTAASIPYLGRKPTNSTGSSRGSPALQQDVYNSRPASVTSTAALYKKSPALSVGQSGGGKDASSSTNAVKRRWEVKTDNLLQPVDNSKTSGADNVSKTIEAINHGEIGSALSKETAEIRARSNSNARHGLGLNGLGFQDNAVPVSKPASVAPTPAASRRQSLGYDSERLGTVDKRRSLNVTTGGYSPTMTDTAAPGADTRGRGYNTLPLPSRNTSTASANRRSSSRVSGDRLSWVRSLEDNNPRLNTQEGKVFRKLEGGVAAKLAKFEQQKSESVPSSSMRGSNKIARSDSANSRTSDGTNSFVPPNLTRRTTIESTSNGSPSLAPTTDKTSVMTKFDESFQQKMELLAGSLVDKADKNGPKTKASTQSLRHALPIGDTPVTVDSQARENHQAMLGDILKLKARPSQMGLAAGAADVAAIKPVDLVEKDVVASIPTPLIAESDPDLRAEREIQRFNAAMLPLFAS